MAEKYKIGSRTSRFGPKRASRTGRGRARSTVQLNQGSSPHKQATTLTPGAGQGGAFGSGRMKGGAAPSVLAALAGGPGPGPSVVGDPVSGPPPVEPTPLPDPDPPLHPVPVPPVFHPPTQPPPVYYQPPNIQPPSPHPFPAPPIFRPPPVDPFAPPRGRLRAS